MESKEFWDQLNEFAKKLKRVFFVFIGSFIIFFIFPSPQVKTYENPFIYDTLIFWIIRTASNAYLPEEVKFYTTSITSPLFILIYMGFMLSLIITIPYAVFEIYSFISPALYKKEKVTFKKYIIPFVILYTLGFTFTIIFILPILFRILLLFYEPLTIEFLINLQDFINLIILLPIIGGLLFCFPIFVLPLIELNLLSTKTLSKNRILIYLIIAFLASLASPDPTFASIIPTLIPIYILFEITLIIGKRIERKRKL